MKLLVSGATGLIGSRLVPALEASGHEVRRLTRRPRSQNDVGWQPQDGTIDDAGLDTIQAVVHLAGENIAGGRWTVERKQRIVESRIRGTTLLATVCAEREAIHTMISASAVGFYGDRGDEIVDETSPAGTGFLAEVCQAWEHATVAASDAGKRVVTLRFGAALTPEGGMLQKMMPAFRFCLGGPVGSGDQWLSWVTLDDLVRVVVHTLDDNYLVGPVNVAAPEPVTNRTFARILGRHLHRPAIAPLPAFVARLVFGELADELLLASTRVQSTRLMDAGFRFHQPTLDSALSALLES